MKPRAIGLILFSAAYSLQGAPLPVDPILRIETGAHQSDIAQLDVDSSGAWAVTASSDKTCRVWELPSGRLDRTLRPPIDDVFEGVLIAAAISPDASLVACGGWTTPGKGKSVVYVFDRFNGKLLKVLALPGSTVERLRFSPDGNRLAAGCWHGDIFVASVADWRWQGPARKTDGPVGGLAFSPDGSMLYASSIKGGIYLFATDAQDPKPLATTNGKGGAKPRRIALSPDGKTLAVGYWDKPNVDLWRGEDLTYVGSPDTNGLVGDCRVVAYSVDGRYLYAGNSVLRRWNLSAKNDRSDMEIPGFAGALVDAMPMPDGSLVLGSTVPSIGILTQKGDCVTLCSRSTIDAATKSPHEISLSERGDVLAFRYESADKTLSAFSVPERRIIPKNLPRNLAGPVLKSRKFALAEGWEKSNKPVLNGTTLSLGVKGNDKVIAYAVLPGEAGIVLAGNGLTRLDERASVVWKVFSPNNYSIVAVNASRDGRFVVGAYADGTIKWHRASDGQTLLSFFAHADRKRWVAWTPTGYYDCSPGGDELVGWHKNNGAETEGDFFPAARVRGSRYRPDVIAALFTTMDESEAVKKADGESGRLGSGTQPLSSLFPPVVTILSPRGGAGVDSDEISVAYELRTPAGSPVGSVWAAIDGRPLSATRGLLVAAAAGTTQTLSVTIPRRDCEVSLIAENANAASVPAVLRVKWTGPPPAAALKPGLFVLCVGISEYSNPALRLGLAAKDANDFSAALLEQEGKQYSRVTVRRITDSSATRDAVLDGLSWLKSSASASDLALLFLAGHGVSDSMGRFYYLAADSEPSRLADTAISYDDLQAAISSITGKALFFVDSCYSGSLMGGRGGQADVVALANGLASPENGAVVFMSSTGKQVSLEDPKWGNGAFTKALVEGIKGKADYSGSGRITVTMLDLYISERVTELTDGRQTPATAKPFTVADFPIARRN